MSEEFIYPIIQEILGYIRSGEKEYSEMLEILMDAGLLEKDAEKMLERLISQAEEES